MESTTQKQNETRNDGQEMNYIDMCTQNLNAIGKAVQLYVNENDDFPEWLSDLHPKYLNNVEHLLCPADKDDGKPFFDFNQDNKLQSSYDYQFHPKYRKQKSEQRVLYGDIIPLVRCRHHKTQDSKCLNLSFSSEVYTSSGVWELTPEDMYGNPEKAIVAIEAGLKSQPKSQLVARLAYTTLIRLYIDGERMEDAKELISRFKMTMKHDDLQEWFLLGKLLEMTYQYEEHLKMLEKLEEQYPNDRNLLKRLAQVNELFGNIEKAEEYYRKSESKK